MQEDKSDEYDEEDQVAPLGNVAKQEEAVTQSLEDLNMY
jgi:hypothetical protein